MPPGLKTRTGAFLGRNRGASHTAPGLCLFMSCAFPKAKAEVEVGWN